MGVSVIRNRCGLEKIAIVGAGEFGLQAVHLICEINRSNPKYEIIGWFDDTKTKGDEVNSHMVLGGIEDIENLFCLGSFDKLFVAIGYNHLDFKEKLINRLKDKIPFLNIISQYAIVDQSAVMGINIMIYPGAIIDKDVKLNDGVTVNLGSIVSHNSTIGNSCFIAPGVTIAGFCNVGDCSFIGAGSTIIDNITINNNCKIGAGAVVVNSLLQSGLYIGIPAIKHK